MIDDFTHLKILDGKEAIKAFIARSSGLKLPISDDKFKFYRECGMPVRFIPGVGYLAYVDNILEFFRLFTKLPTRGDIKETQPDRE